MEVQIEKPATTTVSAIVEANKDIAARPGVTVVTQDNFDQYVSEKLPPRAEPDPVIEAEEAEAEEKKPDGKEPKKEGKKNGLNERISELTGKRKEAEEKAEKAAKEAAEARAARDKAEEDARALRMKYEPPKPDEVGPAPERAQFVNDEEFLKARDEWAGEKALHERRKADSEAKAKQDAESRSKAFQERVEAYKKDHSDYAEKIEKADVKVSQDVTIAILDSEVAPQILEYLAEPANAEYAKKFGPGGLPAHRALAELGRLEAKFLGSAGSTEKKEPVSTISKAPAPISPIKSEGAAVSRLHGHDEVPANMNYEQWKALRQKGKIQ